MLSQKAKFQNAIAIGGPVLLIFVSAIFFILTAMAQAALASPSTEPLPGTVIGEWNWEAYRAFMSDGLAALFAGNHFWHMPAGLEIQVGPTISIPLPKKYLEDMARYASQVKLIATPGGGYVPSGYVAGLLFPRPLEGAPALAGERIFWDSYYRYQPRVQWAPDFYLHARQL